MTLTRAVPGTTSENAALNRLVVAAWTIVAALAVGLIGLFLFTALNRFGYPYELQWMEGGMVDHVRRVLEGDPLYVSPTIDFVPYIYPPLYVYLVAPLSELLGVGFAPLRLISLLSSLGAFGMVALIVWRETGQRIPALLAAGVFAGTYAISGAWLDVGRIDSLFILFTLIGIYLARFEPFRGAVIASGVILALAILTKQTALAAAGALGVYFLLTDWHRLVQFALPLVGIVGLFTLVMHITSDGWYTFYVFDLPRQHAWDWSMLTRFWLDDLRPVWIAGGLGVVYLVGMVVYPSPPAPLPQVERGENRVRVRRGARLCALSAKTGFLVEAWRAMPLRANSQMEHESPPSLWGREYRGGGTFYTLLTAAMIASAWLARLHTGGYINVLIPAFAILAVLFGLGIAWAHHRALLRVLVLGLVMVQFAVLIYNPNDYIPTRQDRAAGDYLIERIRQIPGDVLVFHHGYLETLAGKETLYATRMAVEDVMRGTDERVKALLQASITQALEQRRFAAIIFDGSRDNFILVDGYFSALDANYIGQGEIFPPEFKGAFWPPSGLQVRPYYVFVPR